MCTRSRQERDTERRSRADRIDAVAARELQELARRERAYRDERAPPDVTAKTVIVVDDGLATGAMMRAAVRALKQQGPERIVVAVPAASPDTSAGLNAEADEVVCVITPEPFVAVGYWYDDFAQTTGAEVRDLLLLARQPRRES